MKKLMILPVIALALGVMGCSTETPAEPVQTVPAPTESIAPDPMPSPTVDPMNLPATAVILKQGYRQETGENGMENRGTCTVKITNDSDQTATVSATVIFESADGSEIVDQYPAGSNNVKPGQSVTQVVSTMAILSPKKFKCRVEDAKAYIPTN